MSDGAPRGETPLPPIPNEFQRSMKTGRCVSCGWCVEEDPHYDPDFRSNYMVIHLAERHPRQLPYALVRAIELYLDSEKTGRVMSEPLPKDWDERPKGCWSSHPYSREICQLPNNGHKVHKKRHPNGVELECWTS